MKTHLIIWIALSHVLAGCATHVDRAVHGAGHAAQLPASLVACTAPTVSSPLPLHGSGQAFSLSWDEGAPGSQVGVWAQWRVPEGPVVHTLESRHKGQAASLPASPDPGRALMLQIELVRVCPGGVNSAPSVLRQLQYDPAHACPIVEGLTFDRPHRRLSWQARPDTGNVLIALFDQEGRQIGAEVESAVGHSASLRWPDDGARPPKLIRVTRRCAAERWSTASYLRLP